MCLFVALSPMARRREHANWPSLNHVLLPGASRHGRSNPNHIYRTRGGSSREKRWPGLPIEARERRRYQTMDVHGTQILLLYFPAGCQKEKWEPDRKSQRATTHSLVFCGSVSTSYPCRTLPSNMASGKWRSWSIFGREKYSCRETPLLVMKGKRTLFPDKLKQESA